MSEVLATRKAAILNTRNFVLVEYTKVWLYIHYAELD